MVDKLDNPYRSDLPANTLFVGREDLLGDLIHAVHSGRNTIRTIMGGRGMGKSSFAAQLATRLGQDALTIVTGGNVSTVERELGRALEIDFNDPDLVNVLAARPSREPKQRIVLLIDEIERILDDPQGKGLLDNLLKAYTKAGGKLGVVVLGGTKVLELLQDTVSPFARVTGGTHVLTGLGRDETARLLREPLKLEISDDMVDALWAETAGHPWLLQMFMEIAVDNASELSEVAQHIPAAIEKACRQKLNRVGFRIWWENLGHRGQDAYRRIIRRPSAVPRQQWLAHFGDLPREPLEVLASTGVAVFDMDAETVIARGMLFRRWVEENIALVEQVTESHANQDALNNWLDDIHVSDFERLVIRVLAAWARATVEFPAAAIRTQKKPRGDNQDLQPEAFFQMHAIVALLTHERLTAEPEALSTRARGRSDVKVRLRADTTQRACIEFKIFKRDDETVVKQVLDYAAPEDTFAAVISVDRGKQPMRATYESHCFKDAPYVDKVDAPLTIKQPGFFTNHARSGEGCHPIRVWHFLLQLRND